MASVTFCFVILSGVAPSSILCLPRVAVLLFRLGLGTVRVVLISYFSILHNFNFSL